ncbi:hypothetical protein QAD02_008366 [Eretmocerus hayati]|uniref:Uncharacterized protein n=1 Tax=Eretmocerus hayati TaxID=131215 RepID=A0ACC2N6M8_9HYME|nr:hypothetical protein QAD02_008366 [Eretmocerus hayati]
MASQQLNDDLYLLGIISTQIQGNRLPSNSQVLGVFYFDTSQLNMTIEKAAKSAIKEVEIFWEKSGRLHSDGEAANSQTSSQSDHPSNASQVISCSSQVPNSQHSTQSIADDKATDKITESLHGMTPPSQADPPLATEPGRGVSGSQLSGSLYSGEGRYRERRSIRGFINIMTEEMFATLDYCHISHRNASRLIIAVCHALVAVCNIRSPVENLIVCKTSMDELRSQILSVLVSSGEIVRILDVPALEDSKGVAQAYAIHRSLVAWGIEADVECLSCDTCPGNMEKRMVQQCFSNDYYSGLYYISHANITSMN